MPELTEEFLAKIAGWEAMKMARALLETGKVLSSSWQPPLLRGVVQEGTSSYRASLVVKDAVEIENLCGCRDSRQWGKICAHSVGVGLHYLRSAGKLAAPAGPSREAKAKAEAAKKTAAAPVAPAGWRATRAVNAETGKAASLRMILPPNFAEAIPKNKVMVCLEAELDQSRVPLDRLPRATPYFFGPQDSLILDRVEEWASGQTPGMVFLTAAQFGGLLGLLPGHDGITLGRSQRLEISGESGRLKITAALEPSGEIRVRLAGAPMKPMLVAGSKAWAREGSRIWPVALPESLGKLWEGAEVALPRAAVPAFLSRDWPALGRNHDVTANFDPSEFSMTMAPARVELRLKGGLAELEAEVWFRYGETRLASGAASAGQVWFADPADPRRYQMRDLAAEQAALGRLLRAGFSAPDGEGRMRLKGQESVLNFFARVWPRLEAEWETRLEERLEASRKRNIETIRPRFRAVSSGQNWFDLEVGFETESGEKFGQADIQRLLRSGQSHARMPSGKFAVLDTGAVEDFQEALTDCQPRQQGNAYRIPSDQAAFLNATLSSRPDWKVEGNAAWRENLARMDPASAPPPNLGDLAGVLRPYQKEGVAWLGWLRRSRFGGILADEMGLGKTVQTLAYLRAARAENSGKPSLVVCPTSLVCNWLAEAGRFTPSLRSLDLTGPGRAERFGEAPGKDLLVTSYALLRRDLDFYRTLELDAVILDEAQHIKNRETQNAQAVKALRAGQRLVLTGTPMENSVQDLWSIFDFLMPGYLGNSDDFRERYEIPIARENSAEARRRLGRKLRPFMLRRSKREVASDLPGKIEQISRCDLSEDDRALYKQVLAAARREVTEAADANGVNQARMLVFTALLRLRQICCDRRLLKIEGEEKAPPSAKVELFGELVEEALDGGHRALVFSQFTGMLHLLRERLTAEGIAYCYLDGSTKNRGEEIERFQRDNAVPVFLISLKAGGTGLNLTAADTVIHFDPWWNPAVEEQATDRAHRIGQTRVVTSYKLIARGTVEEKILEMQARKRANIKEIIEGEEGFAKALSWEETLELLSD